VPELERRRRKGRGRNPNWWPDEGSLTLLQRYTEGRLQSGSKPAASTVRTECDYLRGMVFASISLGGPTTLEALRDDPQTVAKILREWPRTRGTLNTMLAAMLRLIDFTVDDVPEAERLKEQVQAGLYPRPSGNRSWNVLPRTVGGSRRVQRRRPVLSQADILKIVDAASVASPDDETVLRDRAIVALACWSGISPYELPTLRWEQLLGHRSTAEAPWCATIHDVAHHGRLVCIPVVEDAAPYLRDLVAAASMGRGRLSGYMFRRSRGKEHPLTYSMTRRIVRLAVQNAGLPACDDTTLKRAYATYLKQRGLNDYAIRDALGLKTMASVESHLLQHRWSAAQRVAAEHHVVKLPGPPANEPTTLQLGLDAGLGDEQ